MNLDYYPKCETETGINEVIQQIMVYVNSQTNFKTRIKLLKFYPIEQLIFNHL